MLKKLHQFSHLILQTLCMTGIVLIMVVVVSFAFMRLLLIPILAQPSVLRELENGLSTVISQPIQVGTLAVSWDGFDPLLKFTQLQVLDNTSMRPLLTVGEFDLGTDLLSDVLGGHIKLDKIRIKDVHFIVRELPDGSFSINGLLTKQFSGNDQSFIWLSSSGRLALENVALTWYGKTDQTPLSAKVATADILWQNNLRHSVHVTWRDLNSSHWQKVPGVENLSGELFLTPDSGYVDVDKQKTRIDFGSLFKTIMPVDELSAHVKWQRQTNGWLITGKNISVKNSDGAAKVDAMSLSLPNDDSSPIVDLQSSILLTNAEHLPNYLPTVLHPQLYEWLSQAFVKLKSLHANLTLQGPLTDFPFDAGNGKFLIDSEIEGMDLHFKPEWPTLQDTTCHFVMAGRRITIDIQSARLLSTPLQNIHAVIPIIKKGVLAMLTVDGDIRGALNDGFAFVRQSPLHSGMLSMLDNFQAQGPMRLQLHMNIPLEKTPILMSVNGRLLLQNNNLQMPQWHIDLNKLNGQLDFTRDSISAPALRATLWDKPLQMAISMQKTLQIKLNYADMLINITPQTNGDWSLALQNSNVFGQVLIPKNKQQPLQANFQRLYLSDDAISSDQKWSPKDLPALTFNAQDFRYGNKQFGQVQMQLAQLPDGLKITTLHATSPAYNLTANGTWRIGRDGEWTQLAGTINSPAISTALSSWGFPAVGLTAQQSTIQFNLSWPGAAYNPSFKSIAGNINLNLTKGQISDISTGTAVKINIGRLLNLLSIKSLLKDIRLDFSDLKATGFSFDVFRGDFSLRDGNAVTQNTQLKSSIADVIMNGRINIDVKNYDLLITVTPHVTGSLPVIAGIVGGPVVGPIAAAATWLAEKVVSSVVQVITKDTYHVTGPWSNPVVEKVASTTGTAR